MFQKMFAAQKFFIEFEPLLLYLPLKEVNIVKKIQHFFWNFLKKNMERKTENNPVQKKGK